MADTSKTSALSHHDRAEFRGVAITPLPFSLLNNGIVNLTASEQTVFIADLHHKGGREEEIDRLLNEIPSNTRRIFFLGDTFHYWVNESSFIQEKYASFLELLQKWSRDGIHLFFLEGNRDFLAARFFDEQPWIDVLPNPSLIEMGGRIVYIGHGDELCWNDWAYQFYKNHDPCAVHAFFGGSAPSVLANPRR